MVLILLAAGLALLLAVNDTLMVASKRELLAAVKTNDLNGGTLRLFQSQVLVSPGLTVDELQECDFTGYASITTAAWVGPSTQADGGAVVISPLATFAHGPAGTGNVAYGWFFLSKATNTPLFMAGNFDGGIPINALGDSLSLVIQLYHDGTVDFVMPE